MTVRERNGTLILISICFLFWGLPRYYQLVWHPEPPDYEKFEELLLRWERLEKKAVPVMKTTAIEQPAPARQRERPAVVTTDTLFKFDPNNLEEEGLLRLGLAPWVVRNLVKYRKSGGVFRKKEDLRRIYGMTEKAFQRIEPYLELPHTAEKRASRDTLLQVDINRASAEEWAYLPGIGPVLSQRIVRFREKLGGFVRIGQVGDTYGLPDSTFRKIEGRLVLSPLLSKLSLNEGSAEQLAAHPYLNRRQARAIVAYRSNHGPLRTAADLAKVGVLEDATIEKILPYLDFSAGEQAPGQQDDLN